LAASAALETGGSSNSTGRSFRGGAIRSRHSRSAARSPSFASSIALRVMVSASPSSRASTASVVLLRVPLSFPAGLPLFPGSKGISGIASVLHFQLSARILPVPLYRTEFFITERKENIKFWGHPGRRTVLLRPPLRRHSHRQGGLELPLRRLRLRRLLILATLLSELGRLQCKRPLHPPGFRTIQVCPKDLGALPAHPEPAVSWHSAFREGAHARHKTTPVHHAHRRRGCMAACGAGAAGRAHAADWRADERRRGRSGISGPPRGVPASVA